MCKTSVTSHQPVVNHSGGNWFWTHQHDPIVTHKSNVNKNSCPQSNDGRYVHQEILKTSSACSWQVLQDGWNTIFRRSQEKKLNSCYAWHMRFICATWQTSPNQSHHSALHYSVHLARTNELFDKSSDAQHWQVHKVDHEEKAPSGNYFHLGPCWAFQDEYTATMAVTAHKTIAYTSKQSLHFDRAWQKQGNSIYFMQLRPPHALSSHRKQV
jgi:hypothetical protein